MPTYRQPRWYIGFCLFLLVIAALLFVCAPIQSALGLWGVAITELILLLLALLPIWLFRYDRRQIFRFAPLKPRQVVGALLLGSGATLLAMLAVLISYVIFPSSAAGSTAMAELYRQLPLPLALLIVAVMPAICEEALHRGLLLHTFGGIRSKWGLILLMALLFGIFHLDPPRFLPTAILGGALTYLYLESGSFLLPMLVHFANNAYSVFSAYSSLDQLTELDMSTVATAFTPALLGVMLLLFCLLPLLILGGSTMVRREPRQAKARKRAVALTIIACLLMAGSGVALIAVDGSSLLQMLPTNSPSGRLAHTEMRWQGQTADATGAAIASGVIEIETARGYQLQAQAVAPENLYPLQFQLYDAAGEIVWQTEGAEFTLEQAIYLAEGAYQLQIFWPASGPETGTADLCFGIYW